MRAERAPGLVPVECSDLFRLAEHPDRIPWVPYRPGVEIFRIYGDGASGPGTVLLRYEEGAEVPLHEHVGYEHILVLAGSQQDENGVYETGSFVINVPGTRHKVSSENGCIVLAIYEKPVRFIEG